MTTTKTTAALALGVLGLSACSAKKPEPQKLNIIYILADDMGYGDLGCYGQQLISTPRIDSMARQGMKFTQYYCGTAVSAPSRTSLMTGLHTGHTEVRGNWKDPVVGGQFPLSADTYTIGEMLKEQGYATGAFGKWGMGERVTTGSPLKHGFDRFSGYYCQTMAHNYYPYSVWRNDEQVFFPENEGSSEVTHSANWVQNEVLDFIKANRDNNFFVFYACTLPHAEMAAPSDSILRMYEGKFDEKDFRGSEYGKDSLYRRGPYRSTKMPRAEFAAMITTFDAYVGQILDLVRASGLEDNTVIMVATDNGPHREGGHDPDYFKSYGQLRGVKRDLYEGGIRSPFIVKGPGISAGTESDLVCAQWDMMATFADMAAGARVLPETDGISIWPTISGKGTQKQHEYLYWELPDKGGKVAVRKGKWKAVRNDVTNNPNSKIELYDLSTDIAETNDISAQNPEIVEQMRAIMKASHKDDPNFTDLNGKI